MELVKNSFLHSTLQQLRLHKLPGMQRHSSSFSFSPDNLGFYFCFRLPMVKVVLVNRNARKAFAPKRTIITPQAGLNGCLQKPKHIIHGNLQNREKSSYSPDTEFGKHVQGRGEGDSDGDTVRMIYIAQCTGFMEAVCSKVKAPGHSHVWKMSQ